MAGGILTNVVKGKMLGNADVRLSQRDGTDGVYRARLQEIQGWFKSGMAHHDHATKHATTGNDQVVATDPSEHVPHARDEFFGDGAKAYFPDVAGDEEDAIMRGAYYQAIQMATAPEGDAKPIVSYWIITDAPSTQFEVFVSETDREVHVMILTPRPQKVPGSPPKNPNKYIVERMYVVGTTAWIDSIVAKYQGGAYPAKRFPAEGGTGIECLQVVSY
jgi:hypothetical protein